MSKVNGITVCETKEREFFLGRSKVFCLHCCFYSIPLILYPPTPTHTHLIIIGYMSPYPWGKNSGNSKVITHLDVVSIKTQPQVLTPLSPYACTAFLRNKMYTQRRLTQLYIYLSLATGFGLTDHLQAFGLYTKSTHNW